MSVCVTTHHSVSPCVILHHHISPCISLRHHMSLCVSPHVTMCVITCHVVTTYHCVSSHINTCHSGTMYHCVTTCHSDTMCHCVTTCHSDTMCHCVTTYHSVDVILTSLLPSVVAAKQIQVDVSGWRTSALYGASVVTVHSVRCILGHARRLSQVASEVMQKHENPFCRRALRKAVCQLNKCGSSLVN